MIDEKKLLKEINGTWKEYDFIPVDRFIEVIAHQPKIGEWIPCSEKMPENEKEVEITYTCKHHRTGKTMYLTTRAFHEDGMLTTEDSDFCWEEGDDWEYVEEKGGYKIPEGWWESFSFSEEFGAVVNMPVIAWRYPAEPYRP